MVLNFLLEKQLDGHECAMVFTVASFASVYYSTLPRGWHRGFIHRYPYAAMSIAFTAAGFFMPLVVPPIRRKLGLPTNQYNAEHPDCVFPVYPS